MISLRKTADIRHQAAQLLWRQPRKPGHVPRPNCDYPGNLLVRKVEVGVRTGPDVEPDTAIAIERVTSRTGSNVQVLTQQFLARRTTAEQSENQEHNRKSHEGPESSP